jgi:DNA-binding HxlR family transcriptional regulator
MEVDGLVERHDFNVQPPHVEYALTGMGHGLRPVLLALREFSRDHAPTGER